jgi:hypothetical protein
MAQQSLVGQSFLITQASRSHSDTPYSVGLLWTSDQPDAETWQVTTHTRERETSMLPAGFEPAIPISERLQNQAVDRAATGIDFFKLMFFLNLKLFCDVRKYLI